MKNVIVIIVATLMLAACAPDKPKIEGETGKKAKPTEGLMDPTKGIGQVKNVTLHNPLDQERVQRGLDIYEMKCSACHRLDDGDDGAVGVLPVHRDPLCRAGHLCRLAHDPSCCTKCDRCVPRGDPDRLATCGGRGA